MERDADLKAERVQADESGTRARVLGRGESADLTLRFHGAHQLMNALAALGAGVALGGSLAAMCRALARMEPLERRGNLLILPGRVRVLDDCYNSNPPAFEQALRALEQIATRGRRLVVAGDMLELGPLEAEAHRLAGERVARAGVDLFFGVGPRMAAAVEAARAAGLESARHFSDAAAAAAALEREVRPGDTLLVKGSRGVHLEKVIEALTRAHTPK
jgi:UDP-N-acetylmuramyl pentapeptide synthase